MDNQQERPLPLSWVAGVAVGEGSFCFAVRRQNGKVHISPVFSLGMQDKESIDLVCETLEANDLPYCLLRQLKVNQSPTWQIQMIGVKRVEPTIRALLPWLTGTKRNAAMSLLEYIDSRKDGPGRGPITETQILIVEKNRKINRSHNRGIDPREALRNPQRLHA